MLKSVNKRLFRLVGIGLEKEVNLGIKKNAN